MVLILILHLSLLLVTPSWANQCCPVKTVSGAGDLDGEYTWDGNEATPLANLPTECQSNDDNGPCVYKKNGEDYCFAKGGFDVQCASSSGPTPPGPSPSPGPSPTPGPSPSPPGPSTDYCDVAPAGTHTMCKYTGPLESCTTNTKWREVDDVGKEAILDYHNKFRNKVAMGLETNNLAGGSQPPAANMKKLVWNDEIAEIAQRWADQCGEYGAHDDNADTLAGESVGQNVYAGQAYEWLDRKRVLREANTDENRAEKTRIKRQGSGFEGDFTGMTKTEFLDASMGDAVWAWYKEVESPGFNSATHLNPYVFDYGAGHYTQAVWADTAEIGCGWVFYLSHFDAANEVNYYWSRLVCNYLIAGNWVGNAMYIEGAACSACPDGYSCDTDPDYPGLCAKV